MSLTVYSWEKKMEVVSRYMLLGNMRVVSEQTGVAYATLVDWKKSDWWPELVDQLRRQKKGKTNESITKLIEQSMEVMQDRLENGDFILNNKTGQIVRKPVGVKEATTIATQLLQRQAVIEQMEQKLTADKDTVADTLTLLAKEFQKWNRTNKNAAEEIPFVEVVDRALYDKRQTGLQEGSGEVHEPAGSNSETSGAEQSPSNNGESRQSS
jgi:hypothetical protein